MTRPPDAKCRISKTNEELPLRELVFFFGVPRLARNLPDPD
jgi:hypothetical protein